MNKRGVAGWIVDFFSILLFILFVIIMLYVFRLSHKGFKQDIQASFEGSAAWIDERNLLNTGVMYNGQNVTFGELLSILGAREDPNSAYYLINQIQQNLTTIAGRMEIYDFGLVVYRAKSPILTMSDEGSYSCEQRQTFAVLPPLNPKDNRGLTIELRYCR